MDKWEWDGTAGGAIKIDFYCSQENAFQIKTLQLSIAVAPGANQQYALHLANSSTMSVAKSWGLIVGSVQPGTLKPGLA